MFLQSPCRSSINFTGSYRPWSSWSEWTECAGGICGKAGGTNRTRTRIIFSRKIGAYFNCTGKENEERQEQEKECPMKECPGKNHLKMGIKVYK